MARTEPKLIRKYCPLYMKICLYTNAVSDERLKLLLRFWRNIFRHPEFKLLMIFETRVVTRKIFIKFLWGEERTDYVKGFL